MMHTSVLTSLVVMALLEVVRISSRISYGLSFAISAIIVTLVITTLVALVVLILKEIITSLSRWVQQVSSTDKGRCDSRLVHIFFKVAIYSEAIIYCLLMRNILVTYFGYIIHMNISLFLILIWILSY